MLADLFLKVLHPQLDLLDLRLNRAIPDISIGRLWEALELTPDLLDHAISVRYGNLRNLRREILILEPRHQFLPLFKIISSFFGLLVLVKSLGVDNDATLEA